MFVFSLILIGAAAPAAPVKCDAKPFALNKPADGQKRAASKPGPSKAEVARPIEKPSCNHPGHGQPGHKH